MAEEEEEKEDLDYVCNQNGSESEGEASYEKTAGDSNTTIRKGGVVKIAAAIDGRNTAVSSTLELEEPEKTTHSKSEIPVLLSRPVITKVSGRSLRKAAKQKAGAVPRDVVYDGLFYFSKEEPKQFEQYDPDSPNLCLPFVSNP